MIRLIKKFMNKYLIIKSNTLVKMNLYKTVDLKINQLFFKKLNKL
jgi:hypothetical protein